MKQHAVPNTPNPESLETMVETFKALADPTRARVVLILTEGERSVGDLVELLEAQQSTVSRHLGVLRAADLVATRRDGVRVYYRLKDAHVGDLVAEAFAHASVCPITTFRLWRPHKVAVPTIPTTAKAKRGAKKRKPS